MDTLFLLITQPSRIVDTKKNFHDFHPQTHPPKPVVCCFHNLQTGYSLLNSIGFKGSLGVSIWFCFSFVNKIAVKIVGMKNMNGILNTDRIIDRKICHVVHC